MAPSASSSSSSTPSLFKCEEAKPKHQETSMEGLRPCDCSTSSTASSSKESRNMMINSQQDDDNQNSDQDIVAINIGCSTPKGRRFRIPDISSSCPPAPKKRRVTSRYVSNTSPTAFYASPDIELFFFLAFQNIPA